MSCVRAKFWVSCERISYYDFEALEPTLDEMLPAIAVALLTPLYGYLFQNPFARNWTKIRQLVEAIKLCVSVVVSTSHQFLGGLSENSSTILKFSRLKYSCKNLIFHLYLPVEANFHI